MIEKLNLKDRPPLTKDQRLSIKELDNTLNLVRARLSFKKIHTVDEALILWGRKGILDGIERTEELTFPKIDLIYTLLFNELVLGFTAKPKKVIKSLEEECLGQIWVTEDFLIESDYNPGLAVNDLLDSIIPPRNPKQKCDLFYFQEHAAKEAFWAMVREKKPAILCPAKTGDGKTFFGGQLIRWLYDGGFLNDEKSYSPWKVLYVTKASIVEQTKQDMLDFFGINQPIDITVTNYEQLRAELGELMIEDKIIVEDGIPRHEYKWRRFLHPLLIIWDECHSLKNTGSIQSLIAQALNDLPPEAGVMQIFMSATPFSRVSHAKCFAVATRKKFPGAMGGEFELTNKEWARIAKRIAAPAEPQDYCKSAIKRLLREFNDYIIPFKNVRRKHKANLITMARIFENDKDKQEYLLAWEEYMKRKAEIEGQDFKYSTFLVLVQLLIFQQKAELIGARYNARDMYKDWQEGFAPIFACKFKPTIAKMVSYLVEDYNIPRNKISLIWGGDAAFMSKGTEKYYTPEQIQNVFSAILRREEVTLKTIKAIEHQMMMESAGLTDFDKSLKLGPQTKEARWEEVKRFQTGKSEFCMFTFKAGGAGLSLHQNKDFLRPRKQRNTPTYNEMEQQQAEGRSCRLTSLNDVDIITGVFRDTIEVQVMSRVMAKRQCLNVVMGHQGSVMPAEVLKIQQKEIDDIQKLLDKRTDEEKEEDDVQDEYDEYE